MQIVIEIPDKTYEYYVKLANKSDEQLSAYERLILRGEPLPKKHGRLIDADKFIGHIKRTAEMTEERVGYGCCTWSEDSIIEDINNEPTIIESQ